jgi:hypothetical protein
MTWVTKVDEGVTFGALVQSHRWDDRTPHPIEQHAHPGPTGHRPVTPLTPRYVTSLPRVRFIAHKGHEILFTDLSGLRGREELLEVLERNAAAVRSQPLGSLLAVAQVGPGMAIDRHIMRAMQDHMTRNAPHVRASAVAGLTGLSLLAYRIIVQATGRNVPAFDDIEEAKDWVVAQGSALAPAAASGECGVEHAAECDAALRTTGASARIVGRVV